MCHHFVTFGRSFKLPSGENNWLDLLIDKCRSLNKLERKPLTQAAAFFRAAAITSMPFAMPLYIYIYIYVVARIFLSMCVSLLVCWKCMLCSTSSSANH